MIQNEEYFILFSDDDIMEANCVEMFYQALACNHIYDVYHYNIDIIDQHENITKHCNEYPRFYLHPNLSVSYTLINRR